jgi:hypothetical protein
MLDLMSCSIAARRGYVVLGVLALITLLMPLRAALAAPLFDGDTVIDVTLSGPFHSLFKSSKKAPEEMPFILEADGARHEIKVRVRGHSRLRVCSFPPLRLNFKSSATSDTLFAGQDKLKLVTHCNRGERAGENALEEYLAYRLFNDVSPHSYRARLMRITYVDTDGKLRDSPLTRYAFVRESDKQLATRLGGALANVRQVTRRGLDQDQAAAVYLYQYLIGNTDWSLVKADADETCCHNGTLVRVDDRLLYVPFDFDLAGLVNPRYARPDPSLRIRRVTQRLYRGYCLAGDALQRELQRMRQREEALLGIVKRLPGLSQDNRADKLAYLASFFREADETPGLIDLFEEKCL